MVSAVVAVFVLVLIEKGATHRVVAADAATHRIGEALRGTHTREEARREAAAQDFVEDLHRIVIRMHALQRSHVADTNRRLGDVALDGLEHAGRRLRARLRERQHLLRTAGPTTPNTFVTAATASADVISPWTAMMAWSGCRYLACQATRSSRVMAFTVA